MDSLTDAQVDAALARGAAARAREPRAATARFDRATARVVIELTNGCLFAFPARLAQGLDSAREDQLAQVEILGGGSGLHWEVLDVDLAVPELLAGLFGTRAYMARQAGRVTSADKAAAARANGAKGGRPRKSKAITSVLTSFAVLTSLTSTACSTEPSGRNPSVVNLQNGSCANSTFHQPNGPFAVMIL